MAELSIIFTIAVILFLSPFLSKYLRTPTTVIEIVLGIAAAYFGLISEYYLFELVAQVGFLYLLFMAGTEVDLKIFLNLEKEVLKKAVIYLMFLYIIASLSVVYLDLNKILMIIVPTLSVGIILALYKDYGKNTDWLNLSMLVGTLGELVSISLLTFAGAALEFGIGAELYKSMAFLIILLVGMFVVFKLAHVLFWWYPELKTYLMPHLDNEEKDLRLSISLFFLMIGLMLWLQLKVAFGAFIAGIFIATFFDHKKDLPHKISSFGFGFLVPIFFIYIGSTFKIATLSSSGVISMALIIVALMIFTRVMASLVFIKILGKINIFKFALSQSMPLTLIIAITTIAYKSQSIDQIFYSSLIFAALIEVLVGMLGIKFITILEEKYKIKLKIK